MSLFYGFICSASGLYAFSLHDTNLIDRILLSLLFPVLFASRQWESIICDAMLLSLALSKQYISVPTTLPVTCIAICLGANMLDVKWQRMHGYPRFHPKGNLVTLQEFVSAVMVHMASGNPPTTDHPTGLTIDHHAGRGLCVIFTVLALVKILITTIAVIPRCEYSTISQSNRCKANCLSRCASNGQVDVRWTSTSPSTSKQSPSCRSCSLRDPRLASERLSSIA